MRWWGVAIVIVAVLGAGEAAARWVGPNLPRESGSEERAFVKADQIYQRDPDTTDVVILGSSETAGGLLPAEVVAEVPQLDGGYNAALAGADLGLQEEWARRVVLRQLDPEVVVISMIPTAVLDLSDIDFQRSTDTDGAYEAAMDQIAPGGVGSLGWDLRQRSALIRYRPWLRSPTTAWDGLVAAVTGDDDGDEPAPGPVDWETETDPERVRAATLPDGEVLDYRTPSVPGGDNAFAVAVFNRIGALPTDVGDLEDLVATVRAAGAAPVISLAPVDRTVLTEAGADLAAFDALAAEVAAWGEANDVPVHDASGETWPPEWFHDRQHVALAGAEAWSASLGTFLADACAAGDLGDACTG